MNDARKPTSSLVVINGAFYGTDQRGKRGRAKRHSNKKKACARSSIWIEQGTPKPKVASSILAGRTMQTRRLSARRSLGILSGLGVEGRESEGI
jgi:hypothetical protein